MNSLFFCTVFAFWAMSLTQGAYVPVSARVPDPAREFRGAWVAVVHHLDWPSTPGSSAKAQKAELTALLDEAEALNVNAIIFQVRPAGDAVYESSIEPWSPFLTGAMGASPGYDPLAFAVQEAHKRGLELHAWFNPFRALAGNYAATFNHAVKLHPEYIRSYGTQRWMDPGEPWVRERALSVIQDVVRRYDIDGVHIDDYFYPYPIKNKNGAKIPFEDDASYQRYGHGQDRAEWRRGNVNGFVHSYYNMVKAEKPTVKVGISPFGIWRPGVPPSIEAQLDAYQDIAADSLSWLHNGWCDYFTPQLYWRIDRRPQSFDTLLRWWHSQNSAGRHVWPGVATDWINGSEDPGRPAAEIHRQIALSRSLDSEGEAGHIHWSIKALTRNKGGIASLLTRDLYQEKALVPASPWLGQEAPASPTVAAAPQTKGVLLSWTHDPMVRWWVVQTKTADRWSIAAVLEGSRIELALPKEPVMIAVRGVSASGVLGPATVMAGP